MPRSLRSRQLKKQLKSIGLKYEVQRAVVGKALSNEEIFTSVDLKACKVRLGYEIGRELIGSGLSHQQIYTKSLKNKIDWTLIFEEDVTIVNEQFFLEDLKLIINSQELISKPNIIQLFSRGSRLVRKQPIRIFNSTFHLKFFPRLVGAGAQAYLINKSALEFFNKNSKLDGAPDWPPWTLPVHFSAIYPWPVYESETNSTVPHTWQSKSDYWNRRIQIILFIHFFRNLRVYKGFGYFFREEWLPYFLYLFWKIRGSKYLDNSLGPQIF